MITRKNIELSARYYGKIAILSVYRGTRLIWEAINSCFGSGFWVREKAWIGTDAWRNE